MGKYLTVKEAANYLGVSALTLRNWDKQGKLAAIRHPINGYRLYTFADLERFTKSFERNRPRKLKVVFED